MIKYRLTRFYPQKIEIEILDTQIISMFPIEIQEHPTFGFIKRVWQTQDTVYDVENYTDEYKENLSSTKTYIKLKDSVMKQILEGLSEFKIILYYQDKEDIYQVKRV
ncbi:hypothetical protein [Sulfurihydrogenibium azorense]|jgi:hypothetical protein|uniref:Uncharacterized protein n=1 Tax=Sulfurihydrogenibium azorense (strain DSM 15241 / OCM 825 / Az-Fu1) TaxID=204536 RepID=C1DWR6_SULAA|nr:hypothetical protein [Sulfurihydrogenibium azorense]ACN98909.1 hypothetical protein SULAZ_1590 [Sulfurihydrogenibium azorense Az-Fu1]MDM7273223.1 hypothetical protein [Sulfurihydrogenibium azorense]